MTDAKQETNLHEYEFSCESHAHGFIMLVESELGWIVASSMTPDFTVTCVLTPAQKVVADRIYSDPSSSF